MNPRSALVSSFLRCSSPPPASACWPSRLPASGTLGPVPLHTRPAAAGGDRRKRWPRAEPGGCPCRRGRCRRRARACNCRPPPHKGQIHVTFAERGGGRARCRVSPTATGRLGGEESHSEKKSLVFWKMSNYIMSRRQNYYQGHLKIIRRLQSFPFSRFRLFGLIVLFGFF